MSIEDIERLRKKLKDVVCNYDLVRDSIRQLYDNPDHPQKEELNKHINSCVTSEERHLIECEIRFEEDHPEKEVEEFMYEQK